MDDMTRVEASGEIAKMLQDDMLDVMKRMREDGVDNAWIRLNAQSGARFLMMAMMNGFYSARIAPLDAAITSYRQGLEAARQLGYAS